MRATCLPVLSLCILAPLAAFAQGSLTPPGAPAPAMKTLQQVEPRIDLATLAGTAGAVVAITQPGSYYLSGNLSGATGKDTIVVSVAGVTIDLNGFTLVGTDPSRNAITGNFSSLTVRNGRIIGGVYGIRGGIRLCCSDLVVEGGTTMGIFGSLDCQIERCRVITAGIQIDDRGAVIDCHTTGANGVYVGNGGLVERTRVANGGLSVANDAHLIDCSVTNAPFTGIVADQGCVIRHCQVFGAGRSGIFADDRARLERCSVTGVGTSSPSASDAAYVLSLECVAEGCIASANFVPGFSASSTAKLRDCIASANTGAGFLCGAQARLVDCHAGGNGGLGVSAGLRSILTGCVLAQNSGGGAYVTGIGSIIERCVASGNTGGAGLRVDSGTIRDCESRSNQGGPGVRASTGSLVVGNTSSSNGVSTTAPQHGFLIEGGRSRVERNHAYNNSDTGFVISNTSSTNSVLVIGNSAGSNDVAEYAIGANNAAGPILTPTQAATTTIPTANFNL